MTVGVNIVRLEEEKVWSLEVVTADGASTVWQEQFASDEEAYAEFERTVSEEGIKTFLDQGNVIPFRR